LTGALHVLYLQMSSLLPSSFAPIKSKNETFWYRLAQVSLEKWLLKQREGRESERQTANAIDTATGRFGFLFNQPVFLSSFGGLVVYSIGI